MTEPNFLTVTEAFQDLIDVGIPPILTLIDAIVKDENIETSFETDILLCAVIGKYCHALQLNHQLGCSPHQCHMAAVIAVSSDPRVSAILEDMLSEGFKRGVE